MAHDISILSEAELRGLVSIDLEAIDVVEPAFAALATLRRASLNDLALCDLTGTSAQDKAISTRALAAARSAGAGSTMKI